MDAARILLGVALMFTSACRASHADTPKVVDLPPERLAGLAKESGARAVLVNAWATWCAPCLEEFSDLQALDRKLRPLGGRVIFVSADPPSEEAAMIRFLKSKNEPPPWYRRSGSEPKFIDALDPQWSGALPITVLFDASGRRRARWEGRIDPLKVERATKALLAGEELPKE